MTSRLATLSIWFASAYGCLGIYACVPLEKISQAPCPCPDGYACCDTLQACLAFDQTCPDTLPISSATPCSSDDQCPRGEVCHAWRLSDVLSGPQTCRRECALIDRCAQGEQCQLILTDGKEQQTMQVGQACVEEEPPVGCEHRDCSTCEAGNIGRTYCESDTIRGCLVALDPVCGLVCQSVLITRCEPDTCEVTQGVVTCTEWTDNAPQCSAYRCEFCPEPTDPQKSSCRDDQVVMCLSMESPDSFCPDLCLLQRYPCPSHMACVQQGDDAICQ